MSPSTLHLLWFTLIPNNGLIDALTVFTEIAILTQPRGHRADLTCYSHAPLVTS